MNLDDNTPSEVTLAGVSEPALSRQFAPVAGWINTVGVIAVLFTISLLGAVSQHQGNLGKRGRMTTFLITMAYQWVLVGIVVLGIRRRGVRVRDLIGGRWWAGSLSATANKVLLDIGIAVAFFFGSAVVLLVVQYSVGLMKPQAIAESKARLSPLSPTTMSELLVFILLSLTAGFCEELVCRGYLQRQFEALTKSESAAILLQGVVFGVSHGYQGVRWMVVLTVFGILFGVLAIWCRSLRPGMIAHALRDIVSGVGLFYIARRGLNIG